MKRLLIAALMSLISNAYCRIAFCKYLDAYANAMAWLGFVQSKRAQDLPDASERNQGVCAAFAVERNGQSKIWRRARSRTRLKGISCAETDSAHPVACLGVRPNGHSHRLSLPISRTPWLRPRLVQTERPGAVLRCIP